MVNPCQIITTNLTITKDTRSKSSVRYDIYEPILSDILIQAHSQTLVCEGNYRQGLASITIAVNHKKYSYSRLDYVFAIEPQLDESM